MLHGQTVIEDKMVANAALTAIIADDHPLFRAALQQVLGRTWPGAEIAEADTFDSMRAVVEAQSQLADFMLLDLHMPGARGFSSLVYVRSVAPSLPVIVVSASEDPAVMAQAVQLGAAGFVPKSSSLGAIEGAIEAVLDGDVWLPDGVDPDAGGDDEVTRAANQLQALTPQQMRVLMMMGEGLLNKQIAYELNVTEATIKAHVTAILRKLNVINRTQAVLVLQSLDIDDPAQFENS